MNHPVSQPALRVTLDRQHFPQLLEALKVRGYQVIGPTLRDGAVVYDVLESEDDLPAGWTDEQERGTYRLKRRGDAALFGYGVGPHSWKNFLHPPVMRLWRAQQGANVMEFPSDNSAPSKLALLGVRSCELHAIAIQDKVFAGGQFVDPSYSQRRENVFVVALNCGQVSGTCFCASMTTGPKATFGFDLVLTEVLEDGRHFFVAEAGSEEGTELLSELSDKTASPAETAAAERVVAGAAGQMGRRLDTTGIKELLYRNYEHPRWDDVAGRCLTCANCTMVCPTCFCSTVEDVTDLAGAEAERWRKWDSCFTMDFSFIHGGSVRATPKSRYRQWLTHKLATWIDQFGTSGCVGCGRCITWCPVGIDITEEVRAIRHADGATLAKE